MAFRKALALGVLSAVLVADAQAENNVSVDAGVSTLGGSLALSWQALETVNLRLQGNSFKYEADFDESEIKYAADLKLNSYGLLADWYAFDNSGFRITVGAYHNRNKLAAIGKPKSGNEFELGGIKYSLDKLDADITFDTFAPYIGIGWSSSAIDEKGFGITADLGALNQGAAEIEYSASGTGTSLPGFDESLAAEARKVEDKLESYQWYPVVSLTLFYRF